MPTTSSQPNASSRWFLIVNGKAAASEPLRDGVARLRDEGQALEVRVTWEHGDAARYANEACEQGASSVIAAGGDGTLNEIAAALSARDESADQLPTVGVLPFGTANDFANACGIPSDLPDDIDAAFEVIRSGQSAAVDMARVDGSGDGSRWFINLATGGVGAEVTTETSDELKRVLGAAAYAITGFTRFRTLQSLHGEIEAEQADGSPFLWKGDFLALGVGNGKQAGGGHALCPQALIDDGLLEIAILPTPAEGEWGAALGSLLSGGRDAIDASTVRASVRQLTLNTSRNIQVNLDGEPIRGERFEITLVPGRLRLHLPADCPLLGPT